MSELTSEAFTVYCKTRFGFTPSKSQLEVFESIKDNKNIAVYPRRSTGKSFLAMAIKSYVEYHNKNEANQPPDYPTGEGDI